jgi:hypothetical protein
MDYIDDLCGARVFSNIENLGTFGQADILVDMDYILLHCEHRSWVKHRDMPADGRYTRLTAKKHVLCPKLFPSTLHDPFVQFRDLPNVLFRFSFSHICVKDCAQNNMQILRAQCAKEL